MYEELNKKNNYCPYILSSLLKEKGFNEPCSHYYNEYGELFKYSPTEYPTKFCFAPTLWQAEDWIRTHLKIHVYTDICVEYEQELWRFLLRELTDYQEVHQSKEKYTSCYTALIQGLLAALKHEGFEED